VARRAVTVRGEIPRVLLGQQAEQGLAAHPRVADAVEPDFARHDLLGTDFDHGGQEAAGRVRRPGAVAWGDDPRPRGKIARAGTIPGMAMQQGVDGVIAYGQAED